MRHYLIDMREREANSGIFLAHSISTIFETLVLRIKSKCINVCVHSGLYFCAQVGLMIRQVLLFVALMQTFPTHVTCAKGKRS